MLTKGALCCIITPWRLPYFARQSLIPEGRRQVLKIKLSDKFSYGKLIRFTLPSVIMMIFTSVYCIIDGLFISNVAGHTSFAAINLIFPFLQITGGIGFMLGTGGTALVSKLLGEGRSDRANSVFTMLTTITAIAGATIGCIGIVFTEQIAIFLGADEVLLPYCVVYARIILLALPAFMLQNLFQSFLVAAERPKVGLATTLVAGFTNIVLDALLIVVFDLGIVGAAIATALAQVVGGVVPLIYFVFSRTSILKFSRFRLDLHAILQASLNGSSELVTNISMSVVSMIYNFKLMQLIGQDGVSAYGVVMYVSFVFVAIFLGYAIGISPVVGYNYGAQNRAELKSIFRKSVILIGIVSVSLALIAFAFCEPLSAVFVGWEGAIFEITSYAFRCYSYAVIFSGICIFTSAFFTALNNGAVSATVSFLRMFLFQVVCVLVLSAIFGINGVWYSLFVAEALSFILSLTCLALNNKKYGY